MQIRVLITGASGFIGRHLTEKMRADGHEVHALGRITAAEIPAAVERARPEVVLHLASLFLAEHRYEQIGELIESNVTFGTRLVDAMIAVDCRRLVCAGTAWQNHSAARVPTNLYAATKEAFESILRYYVDAHGLQACVLKLYDTYGPRDPRRKLISLIREAARTGAELGLSPGEQRLELVHVRDVVDAFTLAATRAGQGLEEFYLRSIKPVSVRELVEAYARETGQPVPAKFGARPYRAREVMRPWGEGPTLPGWQPRVSLSEGLREYGAEDV